MIKYFKVFSCKGCPNQINAQETTSVDPSGCASFKITDTCKVMNKPTPEEGTPEWCPLPEKTGN